MGLSLLVIGTAFSAGLPVLAVIATWSYMMSFSLGIGPGCWLVASEVFPLVIRAKCMALATVANRVFSSLIASTLRARAPSSARARRRDARLRAAAVGLFRSTAAFAPPP